MEQRVALVLVAMVAVNIAGAVIGLRGMSLGCTRSELGVHGPVASSDRVCIDGLEYCIPHPLVHPPARQCNCHQQVSVPFGALPA